MTGTRMKLHDFASVLRGTGGDRYFREDVSRNADALDYQPTDTRQLQAMIDFLDLKEDDVFVDLGCGKGRVACMVALRRKVKRVVGVELREELAAVAREEVAGIRTLSPVEIVCGDASRYRDDEATVYYLFNPFGSKTVRDVLRNIEESFETNPRDVRIVYNNCVHGDCLDALPWLVSEGRITGTPMWVWRSIFSG